mgnify:CR=1 FL=1
MNHPSSNNQSDPNPAQKGPPEKLTTYSMGFAVSYDGTQVLLLEKGKPAFLVGQWIGVGGHIDPGETALQAMVREAKEEADLDPLDWRPVGEVNCPEGPGKPPNTARIHMFAARADLSQAKTMTEERVQVFTWEQLEQLPLASSTREVIEQVKAFALDVPRSKPRAPRP